MCPGCRQHLGTGKLQVGTNLVKCDKLINVSCCRRLLFQAVQEMRNSIKQHSVATERVRLRVKCAKKMSCFSMIYASTNDSRETHHMLRVVNHKENSSHAFFFCRKPREAVSMDCLC